jgi:hypothetical protein
VALTIPPDEGIVGQIGNSLGNAVNYVSETVQGNASEASKEANKEQAKGNVGDTSLTGRASGAFGAASDKLDQHKHEGSAKINKYVPLSKKQFLSTLANSVPGRESKLPVHQSEAIWRGCNPLQHGMGENESARILGMGDGHTRNLNHLVDGDTQLI